MRDLPLWVNVVVFAVAAAAIWLAGTRLERVAARIARGTGLGQAFAGVVLLAIATSLPEVATTVTAIVLLQNPTLAVHNLLGGVAMQTALIAVADVFKKERGALTSFRPRFVVLLQGVGLLLLLQFTIAGIGARGVPVVASVSAWLVLVLLVQLGIVWLTVRHKDQPRWRPTGGDRDGDGVPDDEEPVERPGARTWLAFAGLSAIVFGAGWATASAADVLAEATGLGPAFLGATLLALATSLPELSTTISAARRGRYTTVVSNVFGSNSFDVSLLLLVDVLHRGGSVLAATEQSMLFAATLGAALTCVYLLGLLERRDRTVLGVGWDSLVVAVLYLGGVAVLYFIA